MNNLWDHLALIELTELKIVKVYIDQREEQRVASVFNELLAEEIRLKSHSNIIPDKGVLSTPQSVFVAPFHKGKPQGRAGLGIDECAFCKEKDHGKISKVHHPVLLLPLLLPLAPVLIMYISFHVDSRLKSITPYVI
ncbi:hypothetical protein KIW84_070432 [Lathyrus oleraceus]|uniref:Uncharacterized protein n=1 Tax=Pisum sativum TaxID=3888 RepID=A0A9D4VHU2_PEA|nr:hypothetical protein KIW84_070432 [Pisum sativum]